MGRKFWRVELGAKVCVTVLKEIGADPENIVQIGVGSGEEIPILQAAFPKARWTGIEPDTDSCRQWATKYPGELIKAVAGDRHGSQTRYHGARAWRFRLDRRGQRVPCVSLDGLLCDHMAFGKTFLWSDCDGGELAMLRGARQFMQKHCWWAWLEEAAAPEEATWPDDIQVCDEMNRLGFKPLFRAGAWFPPKYCADTLYVRRQ